jgi:3-mercaptopyruvate sulfurtransferase SseA
MLTVIDQASRWLTPSSTFAAITHAQLGPQVQDFAASRLAEAEHAARRLPGDAAALEPVTQDELARRLRDGQVLVLDVRPDAVRLLRARGFSARPLNGGLPGWRLAGRTVTAAASA